MDVDDLVDAALVGFNRKELVTIPPVSDVAAWALWSASVASWGGV